MADMENPYLNGKPTTKDKHQNMQNKIEYPGLNKSAVLAKICERATDGIRHLSFPLLDKPTWNFIAMGNYSWPFLFLGVLVLDELVLFQL